jgi:hypothetical protein
MRQLAILAVAALALGACHNNRVTPAAQTPIALSPGRPAPAAAPGAANANRSVEQLQAEAARAEAEANRLLAQANGQGAGPATNEAAGTHILGAGSNKLRTGQYYEQISFQATAGKTYQVNYDTRGYRPLIIVLDANSKMFSQTIAAQTNSGDYHLEDEIKPDAGGAWHVLLSAADPGAGGSFTVNMQTITVTSVN